jgi:hypothetical protein
MEISQNVFADILRRVGVMGSSDKYLLQKKTSRFGIETLFIRRENKTRGNA